MAKDYYKKDIKTVKKQIASFFKHIKKPFRMVFTKDNAHNQVKPSANTITSMNVSIDVQDPSVAPHTRAAGKGNVSKQTIDYKYTLLYSFLILCALVLIIGMVVFFAAFKGSEEVLVPNVEGMKLADSLIALQERGIQANIQLRYFSDPLLKDTVVTQRPVAGTVARVGKVISLVVSRGAVVETIKDFVGKTLVELRLELQTLNSGYSTPLLVIGNISYVYSKEPMGTILEQAPLPATPIVEETTLNLIISQGQQQATNTVNNYIGMDYNDAMIALSQQGVAFTVMLVEDVTDPAVIGKVIDQLPKEGRFINPGSIASLSIVPPQVPEGSVFEMIEFQLPPNDILATISVASLDNDSTTESVLFTGKYPGGVFTFPYLGPPGITLILYRYDVEMERRLVLVNEN